MLQVGYPLIPFYNAWLGFSGAIPEMYWNIDSEEQRYKLLCKELCKLVEYSKELATGINANSDDIPALAAELAKFETPAFFEANYKAIVDAWIASHLEYIYDHTINQIFFGLDDTGHLVAYVPDSWDDIMFSTPLDYSEPDYGRLVLSYNV